MSDQNNEKALNYTRPTLSFNLTIILSIFYTIWRIPIVSLYMNNYIAMLLLVVLVLAVLFSSKIYGFKTGFEEALRHVMSLAEQERSEMGMRAKQFVLENKNPKCQANKIVELINSISQ